MHDALWTGGLEPELEYMFPTRPTDPEMRESASIWLFEENGEFAFPRIGLEAVAAVWDTHRYDVNFAFAGGRILRDSTYGKALPSLGPDGKYSLLAMEGLSFRCVEPFRKWVVKFDGQPWEAHVRDQIAQRFAVFAEKTDLAELGRHYARVPTSFEVELTMAVPNWSQDYRPDKLAGMSEADRIDAGLMGHGYRTEQLFRAEGEFVMDGVSRTFRGQGTRVKRQSVRPMGAFRGHCWQSALFPDGRAFAHITYPPREDGGIFSIGFIWQDGQWHKARCPNPPFLRKVMERGDDVALELETDLGITRIEGITELATFHLGNPGVNGMTNQQGAVRYRWDGQEAMGMIERSSPAALTEIVL